MTIGSPIAAAHIACGPRPRVLFLSTDGQAMREQMAGREFTLAEAGLLRDDVSTDEITPVHIMSHYDDSLARFPYTGFRSGDAVPIAPGAVRAGGFGVTVAGHRYGKGSSREHSPAAEKLAGVGLVIARSFERIYRQNADNIGLLTSTDFGLVERTQRGESIPIDELLAGRDELAAGILRSGGLLRFGREYLRASGPAATGAAAPSGSPRTLFEKIIERHLLTTPVTPPSPRPGDGAFVRADWRLIHEYYTGMAAHMLHTEFGRPLELFEPQTIVVFEDHTSYVDQSPAHLRAGLVPNMRAMSQAQRDFVATYGLRCHRTLTDEEAATDDGTNECAVAGLRARRCHRCREQVALDDLVEERSWRGSGGHHCARAGTAARAQMFAPETQQAAAAQDAGSQLIAPCQQFIDGDGFAALDALHEAEVAGGEEANVVRVLPVDAFEAAGDHQADAGQLFRGGAVFPRRALAVAMPGHRDAKAAGHCAGSDGHVVTRPEAGVGEARERVIVVRHDVHGRDLVGRHVVAQQAGLVQCEIAPGHLLAHGLWICGQEKDAVPWAGGEVRWNGHGWWWAARCSTSNCAAGGKPCSSRKQMMKRRSAQASCSGMIFRP
jgi:hypothetical protein